MITVNPSLFTPKDNAPKMYKWICERTGDNDAKSLGAYLAYAALVGHCAKQLKDVPLALLLRGLCEQMDKV